MIQTHTQRIVWCEEFIRFEDYHGINRINTCTTKRIGDDLLKGWSVEGGRRIVGWRS